LVKIALLLLIALNAWLFRKGAFKSAAGWGATPPAAARAAAVVSLLLWVCVIAASRIIGFTLPDV